MIMPRSGSSSGVNFGVTEMVVKHVLEGHDRGEGWEVVRGSCLAEVVVCFSEQTAPCLSTPRVTRQGPWPHSAAAAPARAAAEAPAPRRDVHPARCLRCALYFNRGGKKRIRERGIKGKRKAEETGLEKRVFLPPAGFICIFEN